MAHPETLQARVFILTRAQQHLQNHPHPATSPQPHKGHTPKPTTTFPHTQGKARTYFEEKAQDPTSSHVAANPQPMRRQL